MDLSGKVSSDVRALAHISHRVDDEAYSPASKSFVEVEDKPVLHSLA